VDGFRSNQDQNDLLSQNDKIVQYRLLGNANFFAILRIIFRSLRIGTSYS